MVLCKSFTATGFMSLAIFSSISALICAGEHPAMPASAIITAKTIAISISLKPLMTRFSSSTDCAQQRRVGGGVVCLGVHLERRAVFGRLRPECGPWLDQVDVR